MGIAYVQGVSDNAAPSVSPTVLSMPGNCTFGNTIIVIQIHSYLGCPPSVTDSQGNTYTSQGTHPTPSANDYLWIFTAPVGSTAANTITITSSCGTAKTTFALEYSGVDANPYDQENVASSTTTSATSGSVTTSTANQLILGVFRDPVAYTFTSTGGATTRLTNNQNNIVQDQILAAPGTIASTATSSGGSPSYPNYGFVATFKETPAAGGDSTMINIPSIRVLYPKQVLVF